MSAESSQLQKLEIMLQDIEAKPCDPSLQLLKDVTDQFSDGRQLGRGGFGVVYKGVLGNGKIIAVKKFVFMPGVIDRQFENEVCMEHNGKLCLVEMQERLLCLEYMPNGSLKEHISDESRGLDWHERYKIIKGICCGLHYLHEEKGILHFDLKPANILLTNEMVPKITDFGTSILFGTEKSRTYTESVEGTVGYMAREYLHKGIITNKSDIFSLGVIIIEMITGHRDYPESAGTSVHDFVDDVLDKWRNRLEYLRYSSLEKDCQQIKSCVEIGLRCVQIDARQRPTAKEIVESLNRWDTMIVHVVNEESSPADQVLQNWVNASQPGIPHTVLQADQTVLNAESPRQNVPAENVPSNNVSVKEPPPDVYPSNGFRTCAGCKNPICHGRFLSCMDAYWHPQCFRCFACNKPISEYEPTEADYKALGDGRKLCLECLGSAVMDIPQCQQLYTDIQEFFEGLNMQVEQQVPLLLVERHALNEAMIAEKNGHRLPETRGLFLSEKQTIFRRLFIKVSRRSEVTGIHILYGLPRLLTGSILAHMMMLAYLHLNGYRNLSPEVHAGIGLVLSYMWLEYDIYGVPCGNIASSSAEASSSTPTTSKKGAKTEFEKKFGAFLMRQIETDSSAYGDGFRAGNQAVERYGLRSTLEHIKRTGSFPSLK